MSCSMKKRDRGSNWTEVERIIVVTNVLEREGELFGNFKGAKTTAKDREAVWAEITNTLNAESNSKRDVPQVKKLFDNVKQQVKKYLDARKRPVTGGGEGPAPPTTSQQLLLDHWKGRPGMEGIGSGLDTSNPDLSEVVETSVALSTVLELPEVSENFNTAISAMLDDSSCSTHQPTTHQPTKPVTKSSSGKRKRRSNSYEELEEAEKRRAESEARLYNMQRVWERRKLQAEIEAIKSKTAAEVAYWKKRTALLTAENEN